MKQQSTIAKAPPPETEENVLQKDVKPFGIRDKVGYMFGDCGNDLTFIFASMVLLKFYTDVMGVSSALVGTMMMVVKILDAFTDVTMGQIVDRSKPTKDGKFTPWIKRFAVPVALASFLMYASWFAGMPMWFKVVWMFVTYALWASICYTGVNIPYGSMASALSVKPEDRASLSTWRSAGAGLAAGLISVLVPILIYYTDENGNKVISPGKVTTIAAICSVLAVGAYLLCCKLTTERFIVPQKTDKFDFRNLIKGWFSNKPLMGIILSTFFMLTSQNIMSGLTAYVFPNYFRNPAAQSIATIVAALPLFILAPFMTKLSIKVGRKKLGIIGLSIGIVAFLIAFFIKTTNLWLFIILYGFGNCGVFIIGLICWAMITDVIDDMEVQNGVREDGNVYSVYSFSRKMGQALGTGAAGWTLTVIGYTAKTQFDPNVTQGIYNGICLLPAIFFTLSLLALIFLYPLTRERVENNAKVLADRREQAKEAEIQAEDLGLEEAAKVEDPTVNKVEQPSSDLK